MLTDVPGRVRNITLPVSKPLLPLYEAVVNSIEAIEDSQEKKGQIRVAILRSTAHLFAGSEPAFGDIVGFEVTDNGIGFDTSNYGAFETSDTTL